MAVVAADAPFGAGVAHGRDRGGSVLGRYEGFPMPRVAAVRHPCGVHEGLPPRYCLEGGGRGHGWFSLCAGAYRGFHDALEMRCADGGASYDVP